jgi:hypothetical protein
MARKTQIPVDVREAIGAFLDEARRNATSIAMSDAIESVRRIYPDPEVSDTDLLAAITSEALAADVRLEFDVSEPNNPGSLERWDNEGGAIKKKATGPERREARRRTVNDTDGTRRRAKETKDRHRLV